MDGHVQIGASSNLQLRHAVLVYTDQQRAFATLHEIIAQAEGAPLLAPAQPLSLAFLRRLAEGLGSQVAPEILPDSVLARTPELIVWWTLAARRVMFFDGGLPIDYYQAAYDEAKKAGKIRYIGFTGHKNPAMHLNMLETAATHQFHFDAVQMPLNAMDAHFESFEKKVLPILVQKEIGVLGMKPMGAGLLLKSNTVSPVQCLRYAMSLPTSVVITGCESLANLQQALDVARNFKPLTTAESAALLAKTQQAAREGQFEGYKTTNNFDGTVHNPQWLG